MAGNSANTGAGDCAHGKELHGSSPAVATAFGNAIDGAQTALPHAPNIRRHPINFRGHNHHATLCAARRGDFDHDRHITNFLPPPITGRKIGEMNGWLKLTDTCSGTGS